MYITRARWPFRAPWFFLWLDIVWLVVVVVLVAVYWSGWDWLVTAPAAITDVLPLHIPLAGALGGVTVSLTGCARHNADWDTRWNVWHAVRPFLGAVSGSLAYLILFFVLADVITDEALSEDGAVTWALGFVVAFIAGFRDKYFLAIVAKVADVVFATGDSDSEVAGGITPSSVDLGEVEVDHTVSRTIEVRQVPAARSGTPPVHVETAFAGLTHDAPVQAPGDDPSRYLVTVHWLPTAPGKAKGHLTIGTAVSQQLVPVEGLATAAATVAPASPAPGPAVQAASTAPPPTGSGTV